jgi:hypothetical protein
MFDMSSNWGLGLWLVSTGLFTLSYNAVGRAFPFKGIVSREYRAVNVVKGSVLATLCPAGAGLAVASLVGRPWAGGVMWHTWLPVLSAVYAALDLSAMIHYRDAATTTWVHHALVQLFYLYLEWIGYSPTPAARAIVLLAGVSACEFVVNLRLAGRGMLRGPAAAWLNKLALGVYLAGAYVNLCGQAWLLWTTATGAGGGVGGGGGVSWAYMVVLLAMIGVLVDDAALIKYLWKWQPRGQDA